MTAFTITSSDTVEPLCSHFGVCGGCRFQHIPYDEQAFQKQKFIEDLFGKTASPLIRCDHYWRYRNKMEFSFSQSKEGKKFLGLMQKRGRVVQLSECFLTDPWFIATLNQTYEWWEKSGIEAYRPFSNSGVLRTLTLREGVRTKQKMAVLTISGDGMDLIEPHLPALTEAFRGLDTLVLRRQIIQKKCPTRFEETVLFGDGFIHEILFDEEQRPMKFKVRPSSFFQPNTRQAEILYQTAMKHVEGGVVLDLYCGTGSIGIFASKKCSKVIGVEIVADAIEDAKENILANGVDNMKVHLGDVEEKIKVIGKGADTVIVDPPRAGLSAKTIATLNEIRPRKIIYISCNPASQAANCKELNYRITLLQPVDQFPHTPHIENIAILELE